MTKLPLSSICHGRISRAVNFNTSSYRPPTQPVEKITLMLQELPNSSGPNESAKEPPKETIPGGSLTEKELN
jgi:hypothetical protein